MSRFGWTASIGPGAIAMTYPIQLFPLSVAPICEPFMKVTRWIGEDGDRQSMISRRYGVREVRHCPGSADDTGGRIRSLSAHSETVRRGSGFSPSRNASL
jgi:hypothetical protein